MVGAGIKCQYLPHWVCMLSLRLRLGKGSSMRQPPGPKGLPIIGNLEAYEEDRLGFFTSCAREYGDLVRFNDEVYLVNGPELIERILTRTNREFHVPVNFLRQEIGEERTAGWMRK